MAWQKYLTREGLDVVSSLQSNLEVGLAPQEAKQKLKEFGPNVLELSPLSWSDILLRQFASPFIYMLIAASVLSFLLQQWLEGLMILVFLIIDAALGFFQEFKSEKTARLLKDLIAWRQKVIRGGKLQLIDAAQLVPGDIIVLETGDKISADARLLETSGFSVNESSLTGESLPIVKQSERLLVSNPDSVRVDEALNMVFSGTSVLSGKAKAVVIATGAKSMIGGIARLSADTKKVSAFSTNIAGLSNFIVRLVVITLIAVLLLNIAIKGGEPNWIELFIFSIALAIGVIPEALPLVMTFSFSSGAMRLARQKVVIKRLSSIEDLGNIEILCSDKTGTLTEGKLKVFEIYDKLSSQENILKKAVLATSDLEATVDPFDLALKQAAGKKQLTSWGKIKILFNTPFDPRFLRNNALIQEKNNLELIVRGAPETIISLSASLSKEDKFSLQEWTASQGRLGRRVLAVASKNFNIVNLDDLKSDLRAQEKNLNFIGLISFADRIKKTTMEAVKQAKELDIKLKIISGDSREVAGAIAYEIGLIEDAQEVILASELFALSPQKREEAIFKYQVFARVAPEQKHEIIKQLQEKYSVGYLGDGINDAPALKAAGVSLAVNNAADVAREAADVILMGSDLNVIIDGIKEGRKIFVNSAKYIKATLASNFGNFYAVAIASLLIPFLPMLPLQILLLNLLSDFPMIGIATDNVDKEELSSPKKYQTKDILLVAMILGLLSTVFDFMFFALFKNISPGVLQTNWFVASILTELAFLFSIRSKGSMFRSRRPSNLIFLLTASAGLVTIIAPYTNWGQRIFNFVPPRGEHLLWIFSLLILYIICSEIIKIFYYRNKKIAGA